MANTSDSEDFESADEEFTEEKPAVVPSLKDNCQKELNKLQTTSHLSKEPQPNKHLDEPFPITKVGVSQDGSTIKADAADSSVRQPPADKRRREQKPREPKPQTKLGTRITSPPAEVSPASKPMEEQDSGEEIDSDPFAQFKGYSLPPEVETCWEPEDEVNPIVDNEPAPISKETKTEEDKPAAAIDPYAKFRGYSQPPLMQRCWETDEDGKPILDDHLAKISDTKDEVAVEDPYAEFRGFSKPPLMQRCWVTDSDGKPVLDNHKKKVTERLDAVETDEDGKPILDDHPAKISDTKDEVAVEDPYAEFRGYSKPPLMQRCWVTDSDGKPILDNHEKKVTERLDAVDPPKLEETSAVAEPEDDDEGDVDPFAMFRGYTVEPEEETGWEDDVDDVEIDEGDEEDEAEKKPPIFEASSDQEAPVVKQTSAAPTAAPTAAPASTGFGWGGWGMSSLLATATESVASLTSQVSSALEAGIGAPDPAELARRDKLEERLLGELSAGEPGRSEEKGQAGAAEPGEQGEASGVFGFVSSFTRLVETTGSKVLTGGLDTLESIGKKTMEVLQEGDPGLKKKRAMFSDKTVLSQILREAKDKAEVEDKEAEVRHVERAVHFETLFDDFQGLVHLEALEMLSKQCELKLQALALASAGPVLTALQRRLKEVRDTCQLPEEEEEAEEEEEGRWLQVLSDAEKQLGVPIAIGKLEEIVTESRVWLLEWASAGSEQSTAHVRAISTLARLTAASAEQFHKTAEMLLVKEGRDSNVEAQALITITTVLCTQVSAAATRFCEALSGAAATPAVEDVNSAITSIFLEASNSSSYIQEAFQLLVPVLQVGSAL